MSSSFTMRETWMLSTACQSPSVLKSPQTGMINPLKSSSARSNKYLIFWKNSKAISKLIRWKLLHLPLSHLSLLKDVRSVLLRKPKTKKRRSNLTSLRWTWVLSDVFSTTWWKTKIRLRCSPLETYIVAVKSRARFSLLRGAGTWIILMEKQLWKLRGQAWWGDLLRRQVAWSCLWIISLEKMSGF